MIPALSALNRSGLRYYAARGDKLGDIAESNQQHQRDQQHESNSMYQSFRPGRYTSPSPYHLQKYKRDPASVQSR